MDLFKALIPGLILTFVVCMIMGAGHSTGGWLQIKHYFIMGHTLYWSWVLFGISTVLSWILIMITPK